MSVYLKKNKKSHNYMNNEILNQYFLLKEFYFKLRDRQNFEFRFDIFLKTKFKINLELLFSN